MAKNIRNRNTQRQMRGSLGYRPLEEGYQPVANVQSVPNGQSAQQPPKPPIGGTGQQPPKPPIGGTGQSAPRSNSANQEALDRS